MACLVRLLKTVVDIIDGFWGEILGFGKAKSLVVRFDGDGFWVMDIK